MVELHNSFAGRDLHLLFEQPVEAAVAVAAACSVAVVACLRPVDCSQAAVVAAVAAEAAGANGIAMEVGSGVKEVVAACAGCRCTVGAEVHRSLRGCHTGPFPYPFHARRRLPRLLPVRLLSARRSPTRTASGRTYPMRTDRLRLPSADRWAVAGTEEERGRDGRIARAVEGTTGVRDTSCGSW